jgi:hypothetical protein
VHSSRQDKGGVEVTEVTVTLTVAAAAVAGSLVGMAAAAAVADIGKVPSDATEKSYICSLTTLQTSTKQRAEQARLINGDTATSRISRPRVQ